MQKVKYIAIVYTLNTDVLGFVHENGTAKHFASEKQALKYIEKTFPKDTVLYGLLREPKQYIKELSKE